MLLKCAPISDLPSNIITIGKMVKFPTITPLEYASVKYKIYPKDTISGLIVYLIYPNNSLNCTYRTAGVKRLERNRYRYGFTCYHLLLRTVTSAMNQGRICYSLSHGGFRGSKLWLLVLRGFCFHWNAIGPDFRGYSNISYVALWFNFFVVIKSGKLQKVI